MSEHIKTCNDCFNENEKYKKISELVKEAAPEYLRRQNCRRNNAIKKIAACFIILTGLSLYVSGIYTSNSSEIDMYEDSYISAIGLPVDDYGFLEL